MLLCVCVADGGGGVCGNVSCGMGTCAESSDYTFGFACQCKPGWSRYNLAALHFAFLPCVIPNCENQPQSVLSTLLQR